MIRSLLFLFFCIMSYSASANACALFTGIYRVEGHPDLAPVTLAQQGCASVELRYKDKNLTLYLDGQSRVILKEPVISIVQAGRINERMMMIFVTAAIRQVTGFKEVESVLTFEKGPANDVFLTLDGETPKEIQAGRRYRLVPAI